MTRIEYDQLRASWQELKLPHWLTLHGADRDLVKKLSREQLITWRVAKLLIREIGAIDPTVLQLTRDK